MATIELAKTFQEKVDFNIHMMTVMLGAGRLCEKLDCILLQKETMCDFEQVWSNLNCLVVDEFGVSSRATEFMQDCEKQVIETATEFRDSRIRKGYFGIRGHAE